MHLWQHNGPTSLGARTTGTMTQYSTQSHYPDTDKTSPCIILEIPNAKLGSGDNLDGKELA